MEHDPVLQGRVVEFLLPALSDGGVVVDATLGRGGHARNLLDAAPEAFLVGIDRDPEAVESTRSGLAAYRDRMALVRSNFEGLATVLERLGIPSVRGVLLDLGVSSPQLDQAHRGFGYRSSGPLDMRMDTEQPFSAKDVVNGYTMDDLARVIRRYGEERYARRIAKGIAAARPIETTEQLAEVVKGSIPAATRRTGGHPARRTFQALRIEVNGELEALENVLPVAVDVMDAGARVVVLSYHSLEDRIVKTFFRDESQGCICPPDFPVCACEAQARLRILTRKPVRPGEEEVARNPRAKSARLRAAERLVAESRAPIPDEERRTA